MSIAVASIIGAATGPSIWLRIPMMSAGHSD